MMFDKHFKTEEEAREFWQDVEIHDSLYITGGQGYLSVTATKTTTPSGPFKGGPLTTVSFTVDSDDLPPSLFRLLDTLREEIVSLLKQKYNRNPCIR